MKSRVILTVVEGILFVILIYLMLVNNNAHTTVQFSVSFDGSHIILNTMFIILLFYIIGLISGIIYSLVLGERYKTQIEFYARKTEKLSQQNEIDSDDKEALERKIASLEIALNNALKNKS